MINEYLSSISRWDELCFGTVDYSP